MVTLAVIVHQDIQEKIVERVSCILFQIQYNFARDILNIGESFVCAYV